MGMDLKLLEDIRTEVLECFDKKQLKSLNNWLVFWNAINVLNAYEEGWEEDKNKYTVYYYTIWKEIRPNSINFITE